MGTVLIRALEGGVPDHVRLSPNNFLINLEDGGFSHNIESEDKIQEYLAGLGVPPGMCTTIHAFENAPPVILLGGQL